MVESEPSEEVRLEENSGWRQRRGGDSRGHGGWVRRLRGWVACSASGQRGDVEGGLLRTSQRSGAQLPGQKKNAVATRKGSGDSSGVRVTPPGDGCMVPQVTKSSVGGVRLGRMAAPRRQKRRAAAGRPPERHHSGPRPRLRGR